MHLPRNAVRNFRWLRFLNRPHSAPARIIAAGLSSVLVRCCGQGAYLAQATAVHFRADDFVTGSHLLSWHLHNGWTGRLFQRTPQFNFTTALDDRGREIAEQKIDTRIGRNRTVSWGHSLNRDHHALLYLIARRVHLATDAATRQAQANDYARVATEICQSIRTDIPPVDAPDPKANRFSLTDARTTLLALKSLCDLAGLPWYLVSGTFLGAVREGDFLSHDYDIDIGINIEDFDHNQFLTTLRASHDLTLVNINPYIHLIENADGTATEDRRPALYRVIHLSGIEVDVFIHHKDGDQRWHGSSKHRWTNSEFKLADYEISGITVRGAADADRYLTENYGNWRVPVTVFDCSTGTPNVQFNNNLISIAQTLRIACKPPADSVSAETARMVLEQAGYLSVEAGAWAFTVPWVGSPTTKSSNT